MSESRPVTQPAAISATIRRLRRERGLTQDALAQAVGVSSQAVSKWETGQAMPDITLLLSLSKELQVGVNELLGGNRRQELEKKFQRAACFGEEHTLLVSLEALEEFPNDETFLYRLACDELSLGEHNIVYLDRAIQHFSDLHLRYPEDENYTTALVRGYRARGQIEEAENLILTLKDPGCKVLLLQGEEERRYRQQKIRDAMRTLCTELREYNTRESLDAYHTITQTLLGGDLMYLESDWETYAQQAEICRKAGDNEGFVKALTEAYEHAKQYDGTKRGVTPCRAPLFDLLSNEVIYHGSVYGFLDTQMHLLEDDATAELKKQIVDEQITYHKLWKHEWMAFCQFCKAHACTPTACIYSTQYDYEVDNESVVKNFRFCGYFEAQMHEYYRDLAEKLVGNGIMTGYCAYCGNDILAYLNCGDKEKYFALGIDNEGRTDPTTPEGSKVLAIVDLLVAHAFMHSGVKERLLEHALEQAKKAGYMYAELYIVEGLMYPEQADFEEILHMYQQAGFRVIRDLSGKYAHDYKRYYILQKKIGDPDFEERATRFTFGDYVIDVDVQKTRELYRNFKPVSEQCKCDYCANYQKAVTGLPEKVHTFFEALGIDLGRITESVAYYRTPGDRVHYGGICHVCGKVVKGKSLTVNQDGQYVVMRQEDAYCVEQDCEVWFSHDCVMVEKAFDAPVMQIDFGVKLPWLLDKKILAELPLDINKR